MLYGVVWCGVVLCGGVVLLPACRATGREGFFNVGPLAVCQMAGRQQQTRCHALSSASDCLHSAPLLHVARLQHCSSQLHILLQYILLTMPPTAPCATVSAPRPSYEHLMVPCVCVSVAVPQSTGKHSCDSGLWCGILVLVWSVPVQLCSLPQWYLVVPTSSPADLLVISADSF